MLRWITTGKITLLPFFAKLCLPCFTRDEQRLQGSLALDFCFRSLITDTLDRNSELITPKYFRTALQTKILRSIPTTSPVRTKPNVL